MATTHGSPPSSKPRTRAAVVGAGPVGCLSALSLAARGFDVEMYDRRPDPRQHQVASGSKQALRSINLAISSRGLKALGEVTDETNGKSMAEVVLDHAVPMKARMIHTKDEGRGVKQMSQPYGLHGECINSVSRPLLNDLLLDQASAHPSITVHFDCKLRSIDFHARQSDSSAPDECKLAFEIWEGTGPTTRHAAWVVGCDGLNSIVRSSLARVTPLNFHQEYIDSAYLELRIPPKSEGYAIESDHLHIWPRHSFMLIALANLADKSFTSTLFAPQQILSKLTTQEAILDFFRSEFPDALALMGEEDVVSILLPRKGKGIPLSSIKCNPYHHEGRVVILGDAAHAMLPFYGQGLNCGFEDVGFLMDILDQHGIRGDGETGSGIDKNGTTGDSDEVSGSLSTRLSSALATYSKTRHPDLLAINALATANYHEMSSKVVSPLYLLRKSLDGILMKMLPKGWWMSLYSMVTFSPQIGYDEARRREQWQGKVIERVLVATAATSVVGLAALGRWWQVTRGTGARRS